VQILHTPLRWVDLFAGYGARVELVYLEPPLAVIFRQNERRPRPVPGQVIRRLVEKLEPPTWAEAHAVALIG
jgi:tRNA uridine 5-carbamoylmethylation protein Kti12